MNLPDPIERPSITVEEAAAILGISRATAYDAVREGDIPAIRIRGRLIIPTESLLRLLGFAPTVVGAVPQNTTTEPSP